MKVNQIFEAVAKMKREPLAMGMESMQNDEIALVGGFRSGNSEAGFTRLKYLVYDIEGVTEALTAEEQAKREVGFVELFIKDGSGDIDGLVNIDIKPKFRKGGFGKKVIQSLLKTAKGDLKIHDIQAKAVSFWKKMDAEFYTDSTFKKKMEKTTVGELKKQAKFNLRGIIKR